MLVAPLRQIVSLSRQLSLVHHVFSPSSDMPLFLQDTRASRYWPFAYVANIVPTSTLYALNLLFAYYGGGSGCSSLSRDYQLPSRAAMRFTVTQYCNTSQACTLGYRKSACTVQTKGLPFCSGIRPPSKRLNLDICIVQAQKLFQCLAVVGPSCGCGVVTWPLSQRPRGHSPCILLDLRSLLHKHGWYLGTHRD